MGNTAKAEIAKTATKKRGEWDAVSFPAKLEEKAGRKIADVARELIDWITPKASIDWGEGAKTGSFYAYSREQFKGERVWLLNMWTSDELRIWLDDAQKVVGEPVLISEWKAKLDVIPGIDFVDDAKDGQHCSTSIGVLADPAAMIAFKTAMEWFMEQLRIKAAGNNEK